MTKGGGAARVEIWGRRGLVLVLLGLAVQLTTSFFWSPGAFVLSAAVGLPLVVAGAATFGWAVLRSLGSERDKPPSGAP